MPDPERTTIHRFRNFGEDVWSAYRDNPRVAVDLNQIDRATEAFSIHVRSGLVGRVLKEIGRIARQHMIADEIVVEGDE